MSFTNKHIVAILNGKKAQYKNATKTIRKYVVQDVEKDIVKKAKEIRVEMPEILEDVSGSLLNLSLLFILFNYTANLPMVSE